MALLSFEKVMTCSVSALALAWIVTFASARYEDFINWRRRKQETKPIVKFTLPSTSAPKPEDLVSQSPLVRGYDSGELFREDLWIRRIEQSRRQIAALSASAPRLEADIEARADYGNRVCAMLAHHGVTRCDN
jgi:hypothetical protein